MLKLKPIFKAKGITKRFNGIIALDKVSFEIYKNEIVSLIGPNGAGKSTAFNLINGFLPIDAGSIMFNDENLNGLLPYQIAQKGIAYTFQDIRLFNRLSVLDNVMTALKHQHGEDWMTPFFLWKLVNKEEKMLKEKAFSILEFVGLKEKYNSNADSISYGQMKLLSLARALAVIYGKQNSLILLDEPVAGVHPRMIDNIVQLIKKIRENRNTVLFIEHNMNVVMGISDRVIVLNAGVKIVEGKPNDIKQNKEVILAYLGHREHAA